MQTPRLEPRTFLEEFSTAAAVSGMRIERFGEAACSPLMAATRRTAGCRPRVYLSAGIHGDEPAPPFALLELLRTGCFDRRATWFVCPMLNPSGFTLGTRVSAGGADLNRDYKDLRTPEVRSHVQWLRRQPPFDLVICLHEDWESRGFYLYELNPKNRPSLAAAMLGAAARVCPIEDSEMIDGRKSAEPGILRPVSDPLQRENWPEAIYLTRHSSLNYTIETPSALPLRQRVETHCAAVRTALETFLPQTGR